MSRYFPRILGAWSLSLALVALTAAQAHAQDRLCDSSFEDCRAPLLNLIRNETRQIDVAFWYMTDARYSNELVSRWRAGVQVRVIVDPRAEEAHPGTAGIIQQLRDAGIPMRRKSGAGILHWKMMLFDAQDVVEFSAANYSPYGFVPVDPYRDYEDEAIYFAYGTESPTIVNSFRTRFEDLWTDTTRYSDYANITAPLTRLYGIFEKDPELNFPPVESYRNRAIGHYDAETHQIDATMFRITDQTHTDALIRAAMRGVPVRLISDHIEYRNADRLWHAWNVDRLYMAGLAAQRAGLPGIDIHLDAHLNVMHQKSVLLYGQGLTIFGSSNWTSPSAGGDLSRQEEHNYFTTRVPFFNWFRDQFDRKWNNTNPVGAVETQSFVPQPPDRASVVAPASGATGVGTSAELVWYAGPWAHLYDIYLGTDAANLRPVAMDLPLGPSQSTTDYRRFTLGSLNGGTTYFWRVVSKTMARQTRTSSTWSFTTAGTPTTQPGLPAPWASVDIGTTVTGSAEASGGTFTVRGAGADIWDTSDGLHYVYRTLTGDGSLTTRVVSQQNTNAWGKAGVMMRETLDADSAHASMFVTPGRGLSFQRRQFTGGLSSATTTGSATAPYWVRIVREGHTFTAYASPDGTAWTVIGSDAIVMADTIVVGLPVSSHNSSTLAAVAFDSVSLTSGGGAGDTTAPTVTIVQPVDGAAVSGTVTVTADAVDDVGVDRVELYVGGVLHATDFSAPYSFAWNTASGPDGSRTLVARAHDAAGNVGTSTTVTVDVANGGGAPGLPVPWSHSDIGAVGLAGTASASADTFSVEGAGADVWGTADALHYAYQPLTGDGQIVARVASVENVDQWTKAGVMMRETLDPGSRHAFMIVSPGKGLAFQRRVATGGISTHTSGGAGTAPYWVRLERTADTIRAAVSQNGTDWTPVGTDTIPMAATIQVGLAVSSHRTTSLATAVFDNVSVSGNGGAGDVTAPSASITAPAGGTTVNGSVPVGVDASDDVGVTRVELWVDGSLSSTDATAPYSFAWDSTAVNDGNHTLQARAYDAAGNVGTSGAIVIQVANGGGTGEELPAPWNHADVGAVGASGSASLSGGTFTMEGAGADVWGTADAFHFVYQPMTGDGEVVARVATIENIDQWTKVGVMMRESLDAGSRHAFMLVSPAKGLAFQRRTSTNGVSASTSGGAGTAPAWVKLVRMGSSITAYRSASGTSWTLVGSATISMPGTILVGLAVSSHQGGVLAEATLDSVSVDTIDLPTQWASQDVGGVALAGSAGEAGGTYTVTGSGADIWGTADAFHYAYRSLTGDGEIVARVASVQNTDPWAKAGVMMRGSLDASSAHAALFVSPGRGVAFQRRVTDGAVSTHTSGGDLTAPRWVRLVRTGNAITASASSDGAAWTVVGTDAIGVGETIYVGLAVSSHDDTRLCTATFDGVAVPGS